MLRVNRLAGLFEAEGFKPPAGDTLDEYTNPTEAATGGHIHAEYNIPPGQNGQLDMTKSYCSNEVNANGT
jgi:hypothetical protein